MKPPTDTRLIDRLLGPAAFWRTLRFRFALWVALVLLLAQILVGAFVYVRLEDRLLDTVDDTLRINAAQIHAMIVAQPTTVSLPTLDADPTLAEDLQEQSLTARILTPAGEIVQAYGIYADAPVDPRVLEAARARRDTFFTRPEPGEPDDTMRMLAVPVIADGAPVAIVEIMQFLESVDDTLEQLQTVFQLGVPVSMLLAGLGGYLLAARALARVDRITDMARRLSADDLSQRLALPATQDEIGRLAQTFDTMLTRLQAAFQRERQFTSDASHELRTPLSAMRTIVELTRSRPRTTDEYEQALDDVAEEIARLQALVGNLLLLAREDDPVTDFAPVDLSILLRDLCDSLRPLAEHKGLRLACAIPDGLQLQGDADQLIRLFVNLLDNAIKFTNQGMVTLSAQQTPAGIVVTVSDTGPGIAADHLSHIFDRFYRVDASRSTAGTGLGLTLAQRIVAAHGGTIRVESMPGDGTTFTVTMAAQQ